MGSAEMRCETMRCDGRASAASTWLRIPQDKDEDARGILRASRELLVAPYGRR